MENLLSQNFDFFKKINFAYYSKSICFSYLSSFSYLKGTYFELCIKTYIKGTLLRFSKSYSAVVTKTYLVLKKEKIVNMTIFFLFSCLLLTRLRGTYSKYFQNNVHERNISSAAQPSTTLCSLGEILYTFKVCNRSLNLFFFHLRVFYSL